MTLTRPVHRVSRLPPSRFGLSGQVMRLRCLLPRCFPVLRRLCRSCLRVDWPVRCWASTRRSGWVGRLGHKGQCAVALYRSPVWAVRDPLIGSPDLPDHPARTPGVIAWSALCPVSAPAGLLQPVQTRVIAAYSAMSAVKPVYWLRKCSAPNGAHYRWSGLAVYGRHVVPAGNCY